MDVIFSIFSWIFGIAATLLLGIPLFISFLLVFVPWIGFTQFMFTDIKDVEGKIFNKQLKRLQKVTGMTLPPYTIRFREPVTNLNGRFDGVIYAEFKELLKEDFLSELEKRIKEADPWFLWADKKLNTSIILILEKDRHYMYLKYGRMYYEKKHGGFCISDKRNVQSINVKDFKETYGEFGFKNFGSFCFKSKEA